MIVKDSASVMSGRTTIAKYKEIITEAEGTEKEVKKVKNEVSAINTKGEKPTVTAGLVTAQTGNVIFDTQQKLALASGSLKIGGYGEKHIENVFGYKVKFSDIKIELKHPNTTASAACTNSTTVPVTSVLGILPNTSVMRSINTDPNEKAPLVTARSATSGGGDLTFTNPQTIESGEKLIFENAGQTFTISGNIEILEAGVANATLRFNVDNFLAIT